MNTTVDDLLKTRRVILELFESFVGKGGFKIGETEENLNHQFVAFAREHFGIEQYWHRNILRVGQNTVLGYKHRSQNPVYLQENDLVFLDFGPVVDGWEGDLGRTYLMGKDPEKQRLIDDLEVIFHHCKNFYHKNPDIRACDLFAKIAEQSAQRGWGIATDYLGHVIGEYPHKEIQGERILNYIHPENPRRLNVASLDKPLEHWILEIHLRHREQPWGGFYEDFLTIA